MNEPDSQLREALAYALWRSPWRTRLGGLDACRLAASDLVRHLRRAGYEVTPGAPLQPHGALARGFQDEASGASPPPPSDGEAPGRS